VVTRGDQRLLGDNPAFFATIRIPSPVTLPAAGDWQFSFTLRTTDFDEATVSVKVTICRIVVESFKFTKAFEGRTGFVPKGWATYFVNRLEREKKPFGLYSGGPGVSFSFDPFCANPVDPLWQQFAQEYNQLAIHTLGGNASPIQTQWLHSGDVKIPRKLARPRFTTTYYQQFLG
jgi:hypothetical protein